MLVRSRERLQAEDGSRLQGGSSFVCLEVHHLHTGSVGEDLRKAPRHLVGAGHQRPLGLIEGRHERVELNLPPRHPRRIERLTGEVGVVAPARQESEQLGQAGERLEFLWLCAVVPASGIQPTRGWRLPGCALLRHSAVISRVRLIEGLQTTWVKRFYAITELINVLGCNELDLLLSVGADLLAAYQNRRDVVVPPGCVRRVDQPAARNVEVVFVLEHEVEDLLIGDHPR